LVSSGEEKRARLWKIRELICSYADSRPIQVEKQHGDNGFTCVAVSPNNRNIFSGGTKDKTFLIPEIQT